MPRWTQRLQSAAAPAVVAGLRAAARGRLPQTRGTLRLKGLSAPVEILRDRWGVPHIFAKTATDALFAQGFVHAQERLWQMDFNRRVVAGRLSEIVGPATLGIDRAMRAVGMRRPAEEEARLVEGSQLRWLNAFCDGVNAWIEIAAARGRLPFEFTLLGYRPEPWTPADSFSWAKLMAWTLAGNWESEFLRGHLVRHLGPEKAAELDLTGETAWAVIMDAARSLERGSAAGDLRSVTGSRAGDGVGSNNWVIHGSRTDTGMPILANDMHLELTAPAIWFENHISGGEIDVTGVSLPGVPLVIAGHNRRVAWGYTDGMPDVQDLYEEHLRPADGGWEYEFEGAWRRAEVRQEEIRVKGAQAVVEEVITTHHGPVVNALFRDAFPETPPLALRWVALEPETTLKAILAMNIAGDCAAFREALRDFNGPSQNTIYADTLGNIAYTLPGKIPIRAKGNGAVPSPGWTGEYEWTGYIPTEELPHMTNPPRGFIATANNPVTLPDFSHFLTVDYLDTDRAGRIVELLSARDRVDIDYVRAMQYDRVSIPAREMARCLGDLSFNEPDLREIAAALRDWDATLSADSPLAAVYEASIRAAVRLVYQRHLGDLAPRTQGKGPLSGMWAFRSQEWFVHLLKTPGSPWFDLGGGEGRDAVIASALRIGVDLLRQTLGPDWRSWRWGDLHKLTFNHVLGRREPLDRLFNLGPRPIGGDGSTIAASFTNTYDFSHASVTGPPFRFIASLADLDHCLGMLAPGQSGHVASPHYKDGIEPWFTGGYHPMLVRREEIEQNLEARLVIAPE